MNRSEEYQALLQELETMPPQLEYTVQRAMARKKTLQHRKRLFGIPAGSLAICFTAFVLLVNLFPPFAAACGSVPLLGALAEAVRWSPSLSAAVEHDYVQPVDQSQNANGVTAAVEYLIVDRKQVSIFYTLDTDRDIAHLDADYDIRLPGDLHGYTSTTGSYGLENGALRRIDVNFVDIDVPETLELALQVYDSTDRWEPGAEPAEAAGDYGVEMLTQRQEPERAYLAEFTFHLAFDPQFTAQGTVVPVNAAFQLDGQRFTLTEVEVYPTHLRVNIDDDSGNTAWLKGLSLYLENECGERFESCVNGISASGDPDGEGYGTFWLDSPFFSQGEHLTLCITGAEWLDKDRERIRVDLAGNSGEELPQGVRLEWAEKRENGWLVSFSAPYRWGNTTLYQIWGHTYHDAEGRAYELDSISATMTPMVLGALSGQELEAHEAYAAENRDRYYESFALKDYQADQVWLEPAWTRVTAYDQPVKVAIK